MFHFAKLVTGFISILCSAALLAQDSVRGNYRPIEDALMDAEATRGITSAQLQSLPLDSPLLRLAYCELFLGEINGRFDIGETQPGRIVSLADIRRRGASVVPLLLDMLRKNQDTPLEGSILQFSPGIKTFDLAPFLDYTRNAIKTRALSLNSSNAGSMSALLASHGTQSDLELLQWLAKTRPYVVATISPDIKVLEQRLASVGSTLNPLQESTQPPSTTVRSQAKHYTVFPTQSGEQTSSTPWSIIVVLIVAASGLLWLVLKQRS